jgi:hypothetical protein
VLAVSFDKFKSPEPSYLANETDVKKIKIIKKYIFNFFRKM